MRPDFPEFVGALYWDCEDRMALVSYILGDCPGCGQKNTFGNIDVYDTVVSLGCTKCSYKEKRPLPPVKKKVLYLDQFFFSHAVRGNEANFVAAANLIRQLCAWQLLVVPYSSVHEDETHQWKDSKELFDFIKATSRGHEFSPAYDVEQKQLHEAFAAFREGRPPAFEVDRKQAFRDKLDVWDGYLRIEVGRYLGDIDLIRSLKAQAIEGLVDLFPGWRTSTNTFAQDVALEHEAAAKGYIDAFRTYLQRIGAGDWMAVVDSPIMSQVIQNLMTHFGPDVTPPDALEKVMTFLRSEHFANTPYHDIQARMYATLKAMVKGGAYMNRDKSIQRLSGFYYDVKHISTYAPYCDAFLMDAPMAEIADQVGLEARYGVKVFSRTNWDAFIAWLESLKAGMTDEHKEALLVAYPRIKLPA
jgi:hypothetical protein